MPFNENHLQNHWGSYFASVLIIEILFFSKKKRISDIALRDTNQTRPIFEGVNVDLLLTRVGLQPIFESKMDWTHPVLACEHVRPCPVDFVNIWDSEIPLI